MAKAKQDVSKHFLVPKHTKLSEKEAERVLKKYNLERDSLPRIKVTDPALAQMEVGKGDIIKITRHSPTAGQIEYYRCVIDG